MSAHANQLSAQAARRMLAVPEHAASPLQIPPQGARPSARDAPGPVTMWLP